MSAAAPPTDTPRTRWSQTARLLVGASLASLVLAALLATDADASAWIHRHHLPLAEQLVHPFGVLGTLAAPPVVAAVVAGVGALRRDARLLRAAILLLVSAAVAAACVMLLKPLFGRVERPLEVADPFSTVDRWGRFPSGHATVAFAMAGVLASAIPELAVAALAAAALTCVERVLHRVHLPSDVFAGALAGLGIAALVCRALRGRSLGVAGGVPATDLPPARPRVPAWAAAAAAVVAVIGLALLDEGSAGWMRDLRSPALDDIASPLSVLGSPVAAAVIGACVAGIGLVLSRRVLQDLGARVVAGGIAAFACAASVAPFLTWWVVSGTSTEHVTRNLPSSGAAVAFAVAAAMPGRWRGRSILALVFAAAVALQRVLSGTDLPADVIAGAALGLFVVSLVARWVPFPAEETAVDAAPSRADVLLGLALVATPLVFLALGSRGLSDPDEGRYASIPAEMIARSDFVTPTLGHVLYFEKPPLLYWCTAVSFEVFGFHEWAARLVPALAACAGVGVAYVLGRRMFGARAGAIGALTLATTLVWPAMGRYLTIDMLFSALVVAALAAWWFGRGRSARARAAFDAAFWVLVGLSVLAKGPVGAVLTLGTIGLYVVACREGRELLRTSFVAGALLAVALAVPWFVVVSQRNPSFDRFFWYEQHLGRFFGFHTTDIHPGPPWLYLEFLPLLFLPWTFLLAAALVAARSRLWPPRTERRRAAVFLVAGCAFVTSFFSASAGKLEIYVLPVIPLLAIGLGGLLDTVGAGGAAGSLRHVRIGARVLAVALALAAAGAVVVGTAAMREVEGRGPGLVVAIAAVLVAWAVALWRTSRGGAIADVVAATAGGSAAVVVCLAAAAGPVVSNHTFGPLVEVIRPGLDAGGDLIAYGGWMQSTSFYTGRRVVVGDVPTELAFGVGELGADERAHWFGDGLADVRDRLRSPRPVYCVLRDHEHAAKLVPQLGDGVQEIVWNKRRSIVGNAAAAALTPPVGDGRLAERRGRGATGSDGRTPAAMPR